MWGDNIKDRKIIVVFLLVAITLACASVASAESRFLSSFNQQYDTSGTVLDSCDVCHSGPNGGSLDSYGRAYSGSGRNFASIEDLDSDGDGFTNIEEIEALTFPGDSSDYPEVTAVTISEPIVNETDTTANESVEEQDESEETEIEDMEEETEDVEVEEETEDMEEMNNETSSDAQSPGFEAIFAIAGILSVIYLNKRK
ncbi:PGF-CTERM sorting domain-containing protein [Methanolobus sediminis]|uniref:PGF-CTERM sorting domain-containing protein n=1 Tax=Methanolobus sediminis TaxID=3072978 RepID=A0AA51UND4_9EURY|nr:PGF-CTERM sorting domain-containing protein [Methanolobus sediminis]WMW26238.1 PGF-CTERM sorting domain-containing protein [Methanolobus sediminis]